MNTDAKFEEILKLLASHNPQPAAPVQPAPRPTRDTTPKPTYYNGVLFPSKKAAARAKPPGKKSEAVLITVGGITLSRTEWAQRTGLPREVIRKRIARGMSVEDAVSTPLSRIVDSEISTREKIRAYIMLHKNKPCTDCKNKFHHDIMEFDHCRGEKKFELSRSKSKPYAEVVDEIAKCDVVCANCHRLRTAARRK